MAFNLIDDWFWIVSLGISVTFAVFLGSGFTLETIAVAPAEAGVIVINVFGEFL